jgi:hypothetical protein
MQGNSGVLRHFFAAERKKYFTKFELQGKIVGFFGQPVASVDIQRASTGGAGCMKGRKRPPLPWPALPAQ